MAVLALIPRWFPGRLVPLITQLTVIVGRLGQILSTIPFLWVLHTRGWAAAFTSAATLSVLAALLFWLSLRHRRPAVPTAGGSATSLREMLAQVRVGWRRPGTKLGYCGHTAAQFSVMVFCLLWGYPYLVGAQGVAPAVASQMLTVLVVCSAVVAPVMGVVAARHPGLRVWLLACSALATMASLVNVGGFSATMIVLLSIGLILDRFGGFTLDAFRLAWLAQYPFWVLGLAGMVLFSRRARRAPDAPGPAQQPVCAGAAAGDGDG